MLRERKNMKLYRYFTEEDIKEYKIEDGKIYDEKSRIQSFAYINESFATILLVI